MGIVLDVSADTSATERALDKIRTKVERVDRDLGNAGGINKINENLTQMNRKIDTATDSVKRFVRQAVSFGTIIGLTRKFNSVLDYQIGALNKMAVVLGRGSELHKNMNKIYDILRRTGGSTEMATDSFARLRRSLGEKYTTPQYLKATESLLKAVAISGGPAASAEAALFQLSQGLAAGQLRGQELNSVMEQTPRVARAIADELKVGIGQLRKMAMAGKITAKVVMSAMLNQAEALNAEFSQVQFTIGMAKKILGTSIYRFLHHLDEASGYSRMMVDNIKNLAEFFDNLVHHSGFFVKILTAVVKLHKAMKQTVSFLFITFTGLGHLIYNTFTVIERFLPRIRVARWTIFADVAMQAGILYRQLKLVAPLYKDILYLTGGRFFGSHRKALALFQAGSLEEYSAAWRDLSVSLLKFESSTFGIYRKYHRRLRLFLYEGYKFLGWLRLIKIPLFDFFFIGNWKTGFRQVGYYFEGITDALRTVVRIINIIFDQFIANLMTIESVRNFASFLTPLKIVFLAVKVVLETLYVILRTVIDGFLTLAHTILMAFGALGNVSAGPLKDRISQFYYILYVGLQKTFKLLSEDLIAPLWTMMAELYNKMMERLVGFFNSGSFGKVADSIGKAFLNILAAVGAGVLIAAISLKELVHGLLIKVSEVKVRFSFESVQLLPEYKKKVKEKLRELFASEEGPGLLSQIKFDVSFGSFEDFFRTVKESFISAMEAIRNKIVSVQREVKAESYDLKPPKIKPESLGQIGNVAFEGMKSFGDIMTGFFQKLGTDLQYIMFGILHILLTGNKLVSFIVILSHAWPGLLDSANALVSSLKNLFYDLGEFIGTAIAGAFVNLPDIFRSILDLADAFVDGLLEPFGMLGDVLKGILDLVPLLKIPLMLAGLALFTGNFSKVKQMGKTVMSMWEPPKKGGKKGMLGGFFYHDPYPDVKGKKARARRMKADSYFMNPGMTFEQRTGKAYQRSSGKQKMATGLIGAAALSGLAFSDDFGFGATMTSLSMMAFTLFGHEIPNLLKGLKDMFLNVFSTKGLEKLGRGFARFWDSAKKRGKAFYGALSQTVADIGAGLAGVWSKATQRMGVYFAAFKAGMLQSLAWIAAKGIAFLTVFKNAILGAVSYFLSIQTIMIKIGSISMAFSKWLIPLGIAATALAVLFGATSAFAGDMSGVDAPSRLEQGIADRLGGPVAAIGASLGALALTIWGVVKVIRWRAGVRAAAAAAAPIGVGTPLRSGKISKPGKVGAAGTPTGMAATSRLGGLMWLGGAGAILLILSQIFDPLRDAIESIVELFEGWVFVMTGLVLYTFSFMNTFKKLWIYMKMMLSGNRVRWRDIQAQNGQFMIMPNQQAQQQQQKKGGTFAFMNPFGTSGGASAPPQYSVGAGPWGSDQQDRRDRRNRAGTRVAGAFGWAGTLAFLPMMFAGAEGFGGEIWAQLTGIVSAVGMIVLAFKTQIGAVLGALFGAVSVAAGSIWKWLGGTGNLIDKIKGGLTSKAAWKSLGVRMIGFLQGYGLLIAALAFVAGKLWRDLSDSAGSMHRAYRRNAKQIKKIQKELKKEVKLEDYAKIPGYAKSGIAELDDLVRGIDPGRISSGQLDEVNMRLEKIYGINERVLETYKKEGRLSRWEFMKVQKEIKRVEKTIGKTPPPMLGDNQDLMINRKLHEFYRSQGVSAFDADRILGTVSEPKIFGGYHVNDPKQMGFLDKIYGTYGRAVNWMDDRLDFGRGEKALRNMDPISGELAFFSHTLKNIRSFEKSHPAFQKEMDMLKGSRLANQAFTDLDLVAKSLARLPKGERAWHNQIVMQEGTVPWIGRNFKPEDIENIRGMDFDMDTISRQNITDLHVASLAYNRAMGNEVDLKRAKLLSAEFQDVVRAQTGIDFSIADGLRKDFSVFLQSAAMQQQKGELDLSTEKGFEQFVDALSDFTQDKDISTRIVTSQANQEAFQAWLANLKPSEGDIQSLGPELLSKLDSLGFWDRIQRDPSKGDLTLETFLGDIRLAKGIDPSDRIMMEAAVESMMENMPGMLDKILNAREGFRGYQERMSMVADKDLRFNLLTEDLDLDKYLEKGTGFSEMISRDSQKAGLVQDRAGELVKDLQSFQKDAGFPDFSLKELEGFRIGFSGKENRELDKLIHRTKEFEAGTLKAATRTEYWNKQLSETSAFQGQFELLAGSIEDIDIKLLENLHEIVADRESLAVLDDMSKKERELALLKNQQYRRDLDWLQRVKFEAEDLYKQGTKGILEFLGLDSGFDEKLISNRNIENIRAFSHEVKVLQDALLHDPGDNTFIHALDMATYDLNLNLTKTLDLLNEAMGSVEGVGDPKWMMALGRNLDGYRELHRLQAATESLFNIPMESAPRFNKGLEISLGSDLKRDVELQQKILTVLEGISDSTGTLAGFLMSASASQSVLGGRGQDPRKYMEGAEEALKQAGFSDEITQNFTAASDSVEGFAKSADAAREVMNKIVSGTTEGISEAQKRALEKAATNIIVNNRLSLGRQAVNPYTRNHGQINPYLRRASGGYVSGEGTSTSDSHSGHALRRGVCGQRGLHFKVPSVA